LGEIRSEAWTRTKTGLGSGYRLLTSIVFPIAGFIITSVILWKMTITIPTAPIVGLSVGIGLYILFWFGEWSRHMFAIPPERESAHRQMLAAKDVEISLRDTEIETLHDKLQAPPPPDSIAVTIQHGNWGAPNVGQGIIKAGFDVRIRNGSGVATTLDDWELRSKSRPEIKSKLIEFRIGSPNDPTQTDVRFHPMIAGASVAGSIAFHVTGVDLPEARNLSLEWLLNFVHAANVHHAVTIPTERYSPFR
jgi:hypothetical protein